MQYAVGQVYGKVGYDTITLGGYSVPDQDFGVATNTSKTGYTGSQMTGLMGMGFPRDSSNVFPATTPWWINALQGKGGKPKWPKPMFGMALSSTASGPGAQAGGKLTLGGVDGSAIEGGEAALKWSPVVTNTTWAIHMDDLVLGGSSLLPQKDGRPVPQKARMDTGTAGLMGPLQVVKDVFSRIPGAFYDANRSTAGKVEYYRYPCDAMPEVDLTFGGTRYPLRPESMVYRRNKHNESSTEETCIANLFAWPSDEWIIGDSVFHSIYVAFQLEPRQVGIGKLAA
jgi:hypothetical protein